MAAPRLLVVQHEDECPPDLFDGWLSECSIDLDVVQAHRGQPVPAKLEADGLLVLGGHMGAGDDDIVPWLPATRELIRAVVEAGAPFLGICLGHQLATVAMGGTVERNRGGTTRGLVPVGLTDLGRGDPLLGPHEGDASIHWNGDIATAVPPGASVLATAPDGSVQALRFGEQAWGVQFHPEASARVVEGWAAERSAHQAVVDKIQVALAEVVSAEPRLLATWQPLARRFAALLG
jgi:GMP synthase (glutamine-hydrolysing)